MNSSHPLLLMVVVVGCGDGGGSGIGPPSPGAFGQADVSPECGAFHQACITRGLDSPLAVGSRLGLGVSFELSGSSGPPTTLETSNQSVLTLDDGVATIVGAGVAVILISGPDGKIVDFIHVWSVEPEEIRLIRYSDDGQPIGGVRDQGTLLVGDELYIAVESFTGNQPLIGLFETEWITDVVVDDDPEAGPIVSVLDDVVFGLFRIVARRPGTVRLTAAALNSEIAIELEVQP